MNPNENHSIPVRFFPPRLWPQHVLHDDVDVDADGGVDDDADDDVDDW